MSEVIAEVQGRIGCITLNRPKALNALSLPMIRELTDALQRWREDPQVLAVAVRGTGKEGPFGAFCAGGDIRFFHQAAHAGDAALGDFFTEEYALNHLIHTYPKPYIAFMDGIVMGGGMGISQGASVRVVTERTKMAMPETNIGLFPDVGGGYFLSRCPGKLGEYLGLTGLMLSGPQAVAAKLADIALPSSMLEAIWTKLVSSPFENSEAVERWVLAQPGSLPPEKLAQLQKDYMEEASTLWTGLLAQRAPGEAGSRDQIEVIFMSTGSITVDGKTYGDKTGIELLPEDKAVDIKANAESMLFSVTLPKF